MSSPAVQSPHERTTASQAPSSGRYSTRDLQRLVDRAACFHLFQSPGDGRASPIHRFDIDLPHPRGGSGSGLRAINTLGEQLGQAESRCALIPYDFYARPDRDPPSTRLEPSQAQRFAVMRWTFAFGDGRDGFECFGSGRTYPMHVGGRPRLAAAAVANVMRGFGRFGGLEGNVTFCGELTADLQLTGHVIARIVDPQGVLRSARPVLTGASRPCPDSEATYLSWVGQKGVGADQANRVSVGPDGQVRGMNIPTQLKRVRFGAAIDPRSGIQAMDVEIGEVIGREVGFGRGSVAGAPDTGTPLSPYGFEGVARYTLNEPSGRPLGALTTNVLEGRRFDVQVAPDLPQPGWRFGFHGPIVVGTGCFEGMQGIYYGASGSYFQPPPADHIVTHLYSVRLYDPDGRLRAGR